ncbi:MAG: hypothetical protein P8103_09740 [Candidatus Thiodiazotropha sp.]
MKFQYRLSLLLPLTMALGWTSVFAESEDRLSAIRALGKLNGVALHCNALAETQRMKRALVANLPKKRQLGELFDYETNRSFMAFIENNASCPSPQALNREVDAALRNLESVYNRE